MLDFVAAIVFVVVDVATFDDAVVTVVVATSATVATYGTLATSGTLATYAAVATFAVTVSVAFNSSCYTFSNN